MHNTDQKNLLIRSKVILLGCIVILLALIPSLFWGSLYRAGGDDSRLYYIFPKEFLTNFSLQINSNNFLGTIAGYSPRSFWVPIIFIIFLLKQIPFVNVQFLILGLNLGFGFLFFYLFLGLWIKDKSLKVFYVKLISSLLYILSPYLLATLYTYELLAVFLAFTVPCTLYFFLLGIRNKKIICILLSALIFSVFSSTPNTFPWSYGFFISSLPFLVFIFWERKKIFVLYIFIFFVTSIFLNMHWLLVTLYSHFAHTGAIYTLGYYSSPEFTQMGSKIATQAITLLHPLYRVFSQRELIASIDGSIINKLFIAAKIVFYLFISYAGIIVMKKYKSIYLLSLSCLILTFFLFQPNFGIWSVNLFLFMYKHILFFTVFRAMYDKFSLSMAFFIAFSFCISFIIISEKIKNKKIFFALSLTVVIIILVNARTFIFPSYFLYTPFNYISGKFNDDFEHLTDYIKSMHTSEKFIWIPLNYPSYIYVEDKLNKDHYYWGPSPLAILADVYDYTGYLSFGTPFNDNAGGKLFKLIEDKKYGDIGKEFQKLNIKYIIDNKQYVPQNLKTSLYYSNMLEVQNNDFRKALFGPKIRDFGKRYSLYKINESFNSEKIYLSDEIKGLPSVANLTFVKNSDSDYSISIKNLNDKKVLVFRDLYNREWLLSIEAIKRNMPYKSKQNISLFNNYANGWIIDPGEVKRNFGKEFYAANPDGSINIKLRLSLFLQRLVYIGGIISLTTFLLIVLFQLYFFINPVKKFIVFSLTKCKK